MNIMPGNSFLSISTALFLTLCFCSAGFAQSPASDPRAAESLKLARAALGGDGALNAVVTLSAVGDFRVGSGDDLVSGEIKLEVRLPDRFMRIMKWNLMETMNITTTEAMNGEKIWKESKSGQHNAITMLGPAGDGGKEGRGKKESVPGLEDGMNPQQMRLYFSCLIMALLLRSPDSTPGVSSYKGEITIEGAKADSLQIILKDGTAVNLAIDRATHRPIMASYSVPGHDSSLSGGKPKRRKQGEKSEAATRESEMLAAEVFLSEYKSVAGNKTGIIWLPHQITRTSGGLTVEDVHIKSFQLNPRLDDKQFDPKR